VVVRCYLQEKRAEGANRLAGLARLSRGPALERFGQGLAPSLLSRLSGETVLATGCARLASCGA